MSPRRSAAPPTPAATAALVRAARAARGRAYAPYSRFRVGAAVLTASGAVVTGCNVENASFGLSICAERAAIHRAVAEGHRRLRAVAVATGARASMPCGACRQVMAEFGVRTVLIDRPGRPPQVFALSELLARPFAGGALRRR
ncbi:MAG: cytidine deaminase [Armatimonadota bacterium]|nr:cytidine deaminase [Armatimonadota bacterium]